MPSKAAIEFNDSFELAEVLHRLETGFPDPPDPTVPDQVASVAALRAGAVMLMVAVFEQFVRHAVQEYVGLLAGTPPTKAFDQLPEKLRINSAFKSLDMAMRGPRYGAPRGKLERLPDVVAAARRLVDGVVDPRALSATDGNVDGATVAELLKNLGIEDPFTKLRGSFDREWKKAESQQFVYDKLTQIVTNRHKAAHAPAVLNIGRTDVADGLRFLRCLSTAVDELLHGHVAQICA